MSRLFLANNALYSEQANLATPVLSVRTPSAAGTGITTGVGTTYRQTIVKTGDSIVTEIFMDLTGLKSGASDGDIIGKSATANSHMGQITAAKHGTPYKAELSCVEVPLTGEPDLDLYSATEATGTQDAAVSGLTETALLASAADFTAIGQTRALTVAPIVDQYLYLVCSGGADAAVYTAGQFVLKIWGYDV